MIAFGVLSWGLFGDDVPALLWWQLPCLPVMLFFIFHFVCFADVLRFHHEQEHMPRFCRYHKCMCGHIEPIFLL